MTTDSTLYPFRNRNPHLGKTMTAAQLAWSLKKGFAWADPGNAHEDCHCLAETFYTREGGYQWDPTRQVYELVF